jgi:hypothetical protein
MRRMNMLMFIKGKSHPYRNNMLLAFFTFCQLNSLPRRIRVAAAVAASAVLRAPSYRRLIHQKAAVSATFINDAS